MWTLKVHVARKKIVSQALGIYDKLREDAHDQYVLLFRVCSSGGQYGLRAKINVKDKTLENNKMTLRYGLNPYQKPARVFMQHGQLPFKVLNGAPGYINLLDAFNSWQLVRELKMVLG